MPNSSNTSALPDCEVIARLPCLATVTPAAAATIATVVEILNVFSLSPPVPHTSRISPSRVSRRNSGWIDRFRNSAANAAISSGVSPFFCERHQKIHFLFDWNRFLDERLHRPTQLFGCERNAIPQ